MNTKTKKVKIEFTVEIDIAAYMEEYDIETVKEAVATLKLDAESDVNQWLESRGFLAQVTK